MIAESQNVINHIDRFVATAVNQWVTGSSPVRGAKKSGSSPAAVLDPAFHKI